MATTLYDAKDHMLLDPLGKIVWLRGTTVPTDTTAGYATGCVFVKTDGGVGTSYYINEGTSSSSDFNAMVGTDALGNATATSLTATAGINSTGATGAGIGYATGAGGAVTQGTSRTTTVVSSTLCGKITTTADSMAAQTPTTFTVTNTTVAITDVVCIAKVSGDVDTFAWVNSVANGSFTVTLFNTHASAADTTAFVFNYAVLKSVAA